MSSANKKRGFLDSIKKKLPGRGKSRDVSPSSLSLPQVTPASASRPSSTSGANETDSQSPPQTLPNPVDVGQLSVNTSQIAPTSSSVLNIPHDSHTKADLGVSASVGATVQNATPDHSSTPKVVNHTTVSERLWKSAYARLEEDEADMLDQFYRAIIPAAAIQTPPTLTEVADSIARRLEEQDSERLRFKLFGRSVNVREQSERIIKFVVWAKDVVGAALKAEPHAAVAWAGISLLLPLLLSSTEQNDDMMAGLEQISYIIPQCRVRERLYLNVPLTDTLEELEKRVIRLYTKILEYQIRMYNHLGRRTVDRGLRNLVKADSWSGWLTKIQTLDDSCSKITDLIDVEDTKRQNELRQNMVDVTEATHRAQTERWKNKCLLALRSDYKGHKNMVSERVPMTCEWFLNDKRFLDWRDNQSSALLWVSADPGCGKSVLARCLIDEHLLSNSTTTSTICYFFFKDGQKARNESHHALAALLHGLFSSEQAEDLITYAESSYKNHGNRLSSSFTELWDILMNIVADPNAGEIVCLIDALDECRPDSRKNLLKVLIEFYEHERTSATTSTRLKFIITSRPYLDIHKQFSRLAQASSYIHCSGENEGAKISQEIDLVITARVPMQLPDLKAELQQQIIDHLYKVKGRTYLWLDLILELIEKEMTSLDTFDVIQDLMTRLPEGLYETYAALLKKSTNSRHAKVLLQIITAARRPLNLHELRVAWGLAGDEAGKYKKHEDLTHVLEEDLRFSKELRGICGLLISIDDDQVYLLHQTVREFLIRESASPSPREVQFNVGEAEQLMSRICTKYLMMDCFAQLELPEHGETKESESAYLDQVLSVHTKIVFLQYAAKQWHVHLRSAQDQAGKKEIESGLQLIRAGSNRCNLWLSEWCRGELMGSARWYRWDDLTIAAAIGVKMIVRALLPSRVMNDSHDREDSPLWAAANWGHAEIVELLLAEDFDHNFGDITGISVLAAGAFHGHRSVVELEHGAGHHLEGLEETRSSGETPALTLLRASNSSHGRATRLLDVNAHSGDGDTALHRALLGPGEGNSDMIVRLLIERGADFETPNQNGDTPLLLAVREGNEVLTELLLEKGADMNIKNQDGRDAVQLAAWRGHANILKLLLEKGAVINARNIDGESPLDHATRLRYQTVAQILIDHGAVLSHQTKTEASK